MIKVLVNGAKGKMGQETVRAIQKEADLKLVGQTDHTDNLTEKLAQLKPNVVVDFTRPDCVLENTLSILQANCCPVIGTTGVTQQDLEKIAKLAKEN